MLTEIGTGLHLGPDRDDLLSASRAAAARVLGRRFGIVSVCMPLVSNRNGAELHVYAAAGARRLPGWRFLARATGTGVSSDPELARLAAISEAVESYVSMAPAPPGRLRRSSYAALREVAVDPACLAMHSARQYGEQPKLAPLTEDSVIDWCQGWSMSTAAPVWIPAALVYLTHPHGAPNNFVAEVTSTGIAAHVALAPAILAGTHECLERDAVCIAWANAIQLRRLDPRDTSIDALVRDGFGPETAVALYDVPTDSPCPTVMAVAWSETDPPHAAIGAASRLDHESAAYKALCEAAQMRARFTDRPALPPDRVRTFDDHANFFAGATGARLLRDVVEGGERVRLADLPRAPEVSARDALDGIANSLAERSLDLIVVELTTADVAAAGYRVVRVIVPGLVDASADARFPRLGGDRLYTSLAGLGLLAAPLAESHLNLLPSPIA
ncbi:MAG TPA: YcaO-like family protein [Candidatus Dormibacteraeota bacterium]